MTVKQEKEAIGFDPLAWMADESEEQETPSQQSVPEPLVEINNKSEVDIVEEEINSGDDTKGINEVSVEPVIDLDNQLNDSKIILESTLNIQKVSALHEMLLKSLETQDKIEIDASAVDSIDTSVLQLLTVLKKAGANLHKEIIIDFPSDNFIEAAELLGLSELLEVDQAAAGFF